MSNPVTQAPTTTHVQNEEQKTRRTLRGACGSGCDDGCGGGCC